MLSACPPVVWLRPLGGSAGAGRGGCMHYMRGAGRSVRSPGTSGTTARPSRPISTGGCPASAGGQYRTRSGCSSTTAGEAGGGPASVGDVSTGLPRSATEGPIRRLLGGMQQPRVAARLRALPPGGQAARRGDRSSSGARGPVRLARGQQVHPDSRLAVRIVGGGDPVPRRGLHRHDQR